MSLIGLIHFKIGDKVKIRADCRSYSITRAGSTGEVMKDPDYDTADVWVNFDHVTGSGNPGPFNIMIKHLEYVETDWDV